MKVNPVAIQSYQQLQKRDDTAARSEQGLGLTRTTPETTGEVKQAAVSSRLAVKSTGGTYADYLTPEEKHALDLLFDRMRNVERFGAGYARDASAEEAQGGLGTIVDVKV